ncbi:MAG: glycosyltransferase [Candidatus Pacebacteria bacterium]|nr:glycosyltransferase [Candidatus Paceibacterota bacterium]
MKPKVSVIIATYNRVHYLERAIESVLAQSYRDWEIIIIDDNSTDNTESAVQKYLSDNRIHYIRHPKNIHILETRTEGVTKAQGEYIAMLDDDDFWNDTGKLKKQVAFLESHGDYNLIGTNAYAIDENEKVLFSLRYPLSDKSLRNRILIKNGFLNSSVLFRKNIAIECGLYDKNEKYVEDYGLWLRMGQKGKFANLPDFAVKYRINNSGITKTKNIEQIRNSFLVVKKNKKYYPGFSLALLKWKLRALFP